METIPPFSGATSRRDDPLPLPQESPPWDQDRSDRMPPPVWGSVGPRQMPHSLRHYLLAGALFLLTVGATFITWGAAYSGAVMAILLCHEMGHYVMCRRYRVPSTLPLFVPMPVISPFGTMGAVIFMRQLGQNRKVLFDIGIAGPLAGLIPTLIAITWGLAHSQVVTMPPAGFPGIQLGNSILFLAFQKLVHPGLLPSQDLMLHPVAYAGWAGLFVTALNLLPIGQLDGGHVIYGIFGRRSVYVAWAFLTALAMLAVFNPQWWVLVGLLLFVIGPRHRPALDESIPLDRRRIALGIFVMIVFVLAFTPQPFKMH
jgi:membrane-associated protease RseP (regulator of RpoE activity)